MNCDQIEWQRKIIREEFVFEEKTRLQENVLTEASRHVPKQKPKRTCRVEAKMGSALSQDEDKKISQVSGT